MDAQQMAAKNLDIYGKETNDGNKECSIGC